MTVSQSVASSQDALNLFLVLVTIFTSLQATSFGGEQLRSGGPLRSRVLQIGVITLALAACDVVSLWSLSSIVHLVLKSHGTSEWSPTFAVFLLSYVLIAALVLWQIFLVVRASCSLKTAQSKCNP
jgi:hypothetical protein